jgi:hypothetical protein
MKTCFAALSLILLLGAAGPSEAAGSATAYAIPVRGIQIDGRLGDWPADMIEYPVLQHGPMYGGQPDILGQDLSTSVDLSPSFIVGYDAEEDLIYVGVRVRDDALVVGDHWTRSDGCETYLDRGNGQVLQYSVVPGEGEYVPGQGNPGILDGEIGRTRARAAYHREGETTTYEWAVEGFRRFPDEPVDLAPGVRLPFDVAVGDKDGDADLEAWATWGPYVGGKYDGADRVGELVLLGSYAELGAIMAKAPQRSAPVVVTHADTPPFTVRKDHRNELWKTIWWGIVFSLIVAGSFLYLILKRKNQKEVELAAIAKGISLPERPKKDARKPALVLIALGLAYFIATLVTLSTLDDPHAPAPLAVSIWGIVPLLLGAALWIYWQIGIKGQE